MYIFECSIKINALPKVVFDFHTNVENIIKITPPEIKVTIIHAYPPMQEQEVIPRVKQFGIFSSTMHMKFIEFNPPHILSDKQINGIFKSLFQRRTFTKQSDGNTLLTDRFEYELPFGFIGKFAHELFIRKIIGKVFEYRQETTKKLIETGNEV
ncbi:MAG: SRPBCC family protein [Ignavibacteriae bacterium]|nr:SRPBCC family protein [Ignavibacteriota bacterium]